MFNLGRFSTSAVDEALNLLGKNIAGAGDLKPADIQKIAGWKRKAKDVVKKGDNDAHELVKRYRDFVKNVEKDNLSDNCNPNLLLNLKRILIEAHDRSEEEKNNQKTLFGTVLTWVRDRTVGKDSQFGTVTDSLNSYIAEINATYKTFVDTIAKECPEDEPITPTIAFKLGGLHNKTVAAMTSLTDAFRKSINQYLKHKIGTIEHYFSTVLEQIAARSSQPATSTVATSEGEIESLMNTMPITLAYIKILSSLSGVRSKGAQTSPPKYGEYGSGLMALICYKIDQYMKQELEARLKQDTP